MIPFYNEEMDKKHEQLLWRKVKFSKAISGV